MYFLEKFSKIEPEPGSIALAWLGQAGFLLKNSEGKVLILDAYLSDLAERLDGNKRLMPGLFEAGELQPDVILASHDHTDHLDLDSIPAWLDGGARLYCCKTSQKLCLQAGLEESRITGLSVGDVIEDEGYRVEAVFADHGDTSPAALGFIIETEGIKLYFTGDTSYQVDRMRYAAGQDIDILIPPINGEYGNMDELDAAMLAAQVNARLTIPCHFWTFARHQGSPYAFELGMKALAPDCPVLIMAQGEICEVKAKEKGRL